MIKLALIGDTTIRHHTVADRLWELISVVTNKSFKFRTIIVKDEKGAAAVLDTLRKDESFVGLAVADLPWMRSVVGKIDRLENPEDLRAINMIYKDSSGRLVGANVRPIAIQRALEAKSNVYKCRTVLVIGARGSGSPVARHFCDILDKTTYLYDPYDETPGKRAGVFRTSSLQEVMRREYDVIINATPLGRHYADKHVEAFTSPLDLETLNRISHESTIVQETNCLPGTTLLLQMARHFNLRTVTGELTAVFEAVESLWRYFDITLDANTVHMLVEELEGYIAERELTTNDL